MKKHLCLLLAVLFLLGSLGLTATAKDTETPEVPIFGDSDLLGDLDGNGSVTNADRTILSRYLAGWEECQSYFAAK